MLSFAMAHRPPPSADAVILRGGRGRGRGLTWMVLATAVSCACVALLACSAFVPGRRSPSALGGRRSTGATKRPAADPWKPLVFKMPRKRPPREIKDSDDEFTVAMRKRFDDMQLQEEKGRSEARSVSETKIEDLVLKEADDATINAKYALWRMDRENDRIRAEEENPSLEVMRRRFQERADQLDGKGAQEHKQQGSPEGGRSRAFLDPARALNAEELFASATLLPRKDAAHGIHPQDEGSPDNSQDGEEEWGQDFLAEFQQRSAAEDKLSRRVVKSPDDRRRDYEEEKLNMFLVTAGLGVFGSGFSMMIFGLGEAFGFFLGSIGALLYLSGLANYADNAESPLATATGGRRFLVPIILVLLVIQWYKIEILFPAIASLHLNPSLLATVCGFFTFIVGQVAAGLVKSTPLRQGGTSEADA